MTEHERVSFCVSCGDTVPWGVDVCPGCRSAPRIRRLRLAAAVFGLLALAAIGFAVAQANRADHLEQAIQGQRGDLDRAERDRESRISEIKDLSTRLTANQRKLKDLRRHLDEAAARHAQAKARTPVLGGLATNHSPELASRCQVIRCESFGDAISIRKKYYVIPDERMERAEFRGFVESFIRARLEEDPDIDVISVRAFSSEQEVVDVPDLGLALYAPDPPSPAVSHDQARSNDKSRYRLEFDDRGSGWELRAARAKGGPRPADMPSEEELRIHAIAMKEAWARAEDDESVIWVDVGKRLGIPASEVKRIVHKVEMWKMRKPR